MSCRTMAVLGSGRDARSGGGPPRRAFTGRRPADQGSATVLVVGAIGVLAVMLAATLALLSAVIASHRARGAADLAALAAARTLLAGAPSTDACAAATRIATHNGSVLVACTTVGDVASVTVATTTSWPGLRPAQARARAGPDPVPRGDAAS